MQTVDIEQRSDEWFRVRLGKVTASRVADIIARTKSGYGASRKNYMAELIAERLTGETADRFVNDAMRRGTEMEPVARGAYEFITDISVSEVGFVPHPRIEMAGASPDGLAGDDGLVEIKIPNTATHIETLQSGKIPGKYFTQMQWQMACTGRQWCDFVSFDDRLPVSMQLFIQRVERDKACIDDLETEVTAFLEELDATVADLTAKYGSAEAA